MDPVVPHCENQFNVGVLDGVGVGIAWYFVFRWIILVTFHDDINILFCLRNPVYMNEQSSLLKKSFKTAMFLLPYASLVYTVVKAVQCGDNLIASLIVFASMYEGVFKLSRDILAIHPVIYICMAGPDIVFVGTSGIAIAYGGQIAYLGYAGLGFYYFLLFSWRCLEGCLDRGSHDGFGQHYPSAAQQELADYHGAPVLYYALLYPVVLACYVTIIVKDHGQWVPRPQTDLEYVLLTVRVISCSGITEIIKIIGGKILEYFRPSTEEKVIMKSRLRWTDLAALTHREPEPATPISESFPL